MFNSRLAHLTKGYMSRKTRKTEAEKVKEWEIQKDHKRHMNTMKSSYVCNFYNRRRNCVWSRARLEDQMIENTSKVMRVIRLKIHEEL